MVHLSSAPSLLQACLGRYRTIYPSFVSRSSCKTYISDSLYCMFTLRTSMWMQVQSGFYGLSGLFGILRKSFTSLSSFSQVGKTHFDLGRPLRYAITTQETWRERRTSPVWFYETPEWNYMASFVVPGHFSVASIHNRSQQVYSLIPKYCMYTIWNFIDFQSPLKDTNQISPLYLTRYMAPYPLHNAILVRTLHTPIATSSTTVFRATAGPPSTTLPHPPCTRYQNHAPYPAAHST
jgi:hypothetical protein